MKIREIRKNTITEATALQLAKDFIQRHITSAIIDGYTYRICGPEITRCPVGRESYTYIGADRRIHSAWRHVAYFG